MAEEKKEEKKSDAKDEAAESSTKIEELKSEIKQTQQEIRIFEGMLKNRKPQAVGGLKKENEELAQEVAELEKALFAVFQKLKEPIKKEQLKTQVESLKNSTIRYCKQAEVNSELWKSIES